MRSNYNRGCEITQKCALQKHKKPLQYCSHSVLDSWSLMCLHWSYHTHFSCTTVSAGLKKWFTPFPELLVPVPYVVEITLQKKRPGDWESVGKIMWLQGKALSFCSLNSLPASRHRGWSLPEQWEEKEESLRRVKTSRLVFIWLVTRRNTPHTYRHFGARTSWSQLCGFRAATCFFQWNLWLWCFEVDVVWFSCVAGTEDIM